MKRLTLNLFGTALFCAGISAVNLSAASADPPRVIASIKPIHSLAASVMQGVGKPDVLIEGTASPHGYRLKPSQAAGLAQADIVLWIGPGLETFLERPLETLSGDATVVELIETPGLTLYDFREGGSFEGHDHDEDEHDEHAHDDHDEDEHEEHAHDDHDEDEHEEHAHDDHNEDEHEEHAHDDHDEDEHEEHAHDDHDHEGGIDPHVWLDPHNAGVMTDRIVAVLSEQDPANAATYRRNGDALKEGLEALEQQIAARLHPLEDQPFLSFHDAYRYFEERFHLHAVGTISINPEVAPSAERVREIQETLRSSAAACVFTEPQFSAKLITVVSEGSNARVGMLDPLGADHAAGPTHYVDTLQAMADAFHGCLTPEG